MNGEAHSIVVFPERRTSPVRRGREPDASVVVFPPGQLDKPETDPVALARVEGAAASVDLPDDANLNAVRRALQRLIRFLRGGGAALFFVAATADGEPWSLDYMPPTNTVYTSQQVDEAVAAATLTALAYTADVRAYAVAVSNTLDAAIQAAEPGDYATVSNRAMTALQSYTETDPLVPAWAKAENKPSYTAAEVGAAATSHTHPTSDVTGLDDEFASKAATNHGHRLEYNYPSLYTDQPEGTMFKANNKNEVVPAVAGTDYVVPASLASVASSGSYRDLRDTPPIPTVPTKVSAFTNDAGYLTAHQSLAGYATTAALGAAATAATNYTDAAIAAATPAAPTWDTANVGANPTVALAVAPNTAYMRTGSGTLTLSSVTGLSPASTYCVFAGFDALVLPPGFDVAGSGAFRAGREVHLALWATPTTNIVEFLFAR